MDVQAIRNQILEHRMDAGHMHARVATGASVGRRDPLIGPTRCAKGLCMAVPPKFTVFSVETLASAIMPLWSDEDLRQFSRAFPKWERLKHTHSVLRVPVGSDVKEAPWRTGCLITGHGHALFLLEGCVE